MSFDADVVPGSLRRFRPLPSIRLSPPQHRLEESRCIASPHLHHLFWRPRGHDLAAAVATFRPEVDDPVGGLDHFQIVLDHHHGISGLHQLVQHVEQLCHVVKMKPGGGLVQNVKRAAGSALAQLLGEFDALGFAARERVGLLADMDVAEADLLQGREHVADARHGLEERRRLVDGHVEHVGDRLALEGHLQGLAVVALALADVAGDVDVGQKVHLDLDHAVALAGLAAPALDVEREAAGLVAARLSLGRFSFNVKGGRCEACQGDGVIKIEMHFLPDVYVTCDVCKGKRYNRETLEVLFKGKSIADVLDMTVEEAAEFFKAVPRVRETFKTLHRVGLDYIHVGQQATTLSGGEAQRVKLAKELSKRATGRTLYILDEPTTGLHFHDVKKLLEVLHELVSQGNTVVVIEHNLEVIKTADWVIDLGPEGGDGGGEIVAWGPPEDLVKAPRSYTGKFLAPVLAKQDRGKRKRGASEAAE